MFFEPFMAKQLAAFEVVSYDTKFPRKPNRSHPYKRMKSGINRPIGNYVTRIPKDLSKRIELQTCS